MQEQPTERSATKQDLSVTPDVVLARRVRPTRSPAREPHPQGISRNDILFALFKHKKKIVVGAVLGMVGAIAVYLAWPAQYESGAKLLVRYLVERSTVDNVDASHAPGSSISTSDAIIESEMQILTSWDLAVDAAEAIGPKRLLPNSGTVSTEAAAGIIASGLKVTTEKGSNIIFVSYRSHDPTLAPIVLNEIVNRYFNKHLEVHRSAGAFDFVTQQTDQVRSRLNQTEDALRGLKEKAGIVSLEASTTNLNAEAERVEEQLNFAKADLAEEQARFRQLNGTPGGVTVVPGNEDFSGTDRLLSDGVTAPDNSRKDEASPSPPPEIPVGIIERYQVLSSGLQKLRQTQLELFSKYTPQSQMVKANQAEIDDLDHQLRSLEHKYPDLPNRAGAIGGLGNDSVGPAASAARLAGLRAKRNTLALRLQEIRKKIEQLAKMSPQINDLERQKQLEETSYKYFEATLEKARVDEALDPSKIPNISAVQRPSPPVPVTKTRNKIALGVALAGVGAAVGFALLKELILSATIRRPVEIERHTGSTPLMSIPYRPQFNGSSTKSDGKSRTIVTQGGNKKQLAPWDSGHFIRSYSEAIRDRLGLYFELHNLTHKPKLVGVASLSGKAGTSTLAAGLAAAISETNDGKVLLVDVNLGPDQVHPFFRGKPAYALNDALEATREIDAAGENLYLAMVGTPNASPAQLGLKRFFDLMPNLKASEFDYIIFDMPPLEQTSPSWGMAPFMDKMLVVVEAERNTRDAVNRVYHRLLHERDNVSLVLNKLRSYAPKRLELDY
jgi:polysaccharide biosynthesis transport protein